MRLFDIFEAELDPTGWGSTPMGTNVAYEGLRVRMKPSVFLWLAHQLDPSSVNPEVDKHMAGGGKIAHPFLQVAIPPEWEDGNFKKPAKVVGHEGRNRMTNWIKMKGDEPIEIQIFPRGGMRRHHITDDMIKELASGMFNEDGDFTRGPLFDVSSALEESIEDNPNFARWFAGSKIVDAQGKPLVVYHGTSGDFPAFSKKGVRPNFTSPQKHLGFFFTDNAHYAGVYAGRGFDNEDANIIPVYLSIKNPLRAPISLIDEIEGKWTQTKAKQFVEKIKSQGHDGIIFSGGSKKFGNINEYVAFDPKQIKSAISSKFGDNPNIVDEGWKDWVAAGAMGAAALGAQAKAPAMWTEPNPAHAKAKQVQQVKQAAPKQTHTLKAQPQQAQAPIEMNLLSNNINSEAILHKTAVRSGIRGIELAQFMAQTKHESADFSRMKEIGGKEYFHKRYDPKTAPKTAKILGNTHAGDGIRYHGRGFIQITGRDNYRMAGEALGLPLEAQPELASKPEVAAKIAVWYWKTRVKPNISNFADTAAVTKYINPALRGLEDRKSNFMDYKRII